MTIWMDKINYHMDYNLMSDFSYYCNIGIYAWYVVLKVNCFIFWISHSLHVSYRYKHGSVYMLPCKNQTHFLVYSWNLIRLKYNCNDNFHLYELNKTMNIRHVLEHPYPYFPWNWGSVSATISNVILSVDDDDDWCFTATFVHMVG